jgi:ATP-dependent DNA helicase UvrD/PcrA
MIEPSPAQIGVRDDPSLSLLVTAPAGCGKTEALAMRLAALVVRQQGGPSRRALALTFSNKARDNLRGRLADYLPHGFLRDRVTISNLHGFAARIVRAHGSRVGVDRDWLFPETDWVRDYCQDQQFSWGQINAVERALRDSKLAGGHDSDVEAWLRARGHDLALGVELARRADKQLTYDDLLRLAELILRDDQVANLYRCHVAFALVDEFQDLSLQQLKIVNRVAWARTTYAGDLAQGIYGFAGAAPAAVLEAIRQEVESEHVLVTSHRSSPAVLEAVNALRHRTGGVHLTAADPASWPGGGCAATMTFASVQEEAAWAIAFAAYVLGKAPHQRIGVMARTGSRRRFLDEAFDTAALPVLRWDDPLLDGPAAEVVQSTLEKTSVAALGDGDERLAGLRALCELDSIDDPSTRQSVREAMLWVVEQLDLGLSLEAIRERVVQSPSSSVLSTPGVHLLTGHAGKGQQFDWVVVVGLEEGGIPDFRAEDGEGLAEEARILSVMISRARHGVVLTRSMGLVSLAGKPYTRDESPFLRELVDEGAVVDRPEATAWFNEVNWEAISRR